MAVDLDQWNRDALGDFLATRPRYEQLAAEVRFQLAALISAKRIDVASVVHRTKTLESFIQKLERKHYRYPMLEVTDIAGARVVCLYRSDLPRIERVVERAFRVIERVERAPGDVDRFGYEALHYIVTVRPQPCGARYDQLRDLRCEIQVRTALQDAWAILDHHLRYKSEREIPGLLSRQINALAGALDSADSAFDRIALDRAAYVRRLANPRRSFATLLREETNRDAIIVYLNRTLPDHTLEMFPGHLSRVVLRHLDKRRFPTLAAIDSAMKATAAVRRQYRRDQYASSAAAQLAIALACVDGTYRDKTYMGAQARKVVDAFLRPHRAAGPKPTPKPAVRKASRKVAPKPPQATRSTRPGAWTRAPRTAARAATLPSGKAKRTSRSVLRRRRTR